MPFAGSRQLNERRRRRLAQESVCEEVVDNASTSKPSVEPSDEADTPAVWRQLPDESIIPQSWVQIGLLVATAFSGWLGIMYFSLAAQRSTSPLAYLFSLESRRVTDYFSSLSLLLASQLSFVILWYRSQSRKDFSGRYRLWAWAGLFWGICSFSVATQIHRPLAEILFEFWPTNCWRPHTLYWFGPLAVGFLSVHRLLARETRQFRLSRFCWNSTMVVGMFTGGLYLGAEVLVSESFREFVIIAVTSFWQALVAVSLLIHARYVVHVSNEVHIRVPSRIVQLRNFVRQRWQLAKEQLKADETEEEGTNENSKPKRVSSRVAPTRKQATDQPSTQDRSTASSAASGTSSPDPKPKRRVLGQNAIRVDDAESTKAPRTAPVAEEQSSDEVDLSKLSKKERRRLRKQLKK